MSSIQERLAAFITAVGGDIKILSDRTAKIPPPYATGAPAGGSDKDLAIRTDDTVPPNAAAGDNPGIWQKQGGAYVRVAPRVKHGDNHAISGIDPLYLTDLGSLEDAFRSSEVSTVDRAMTASITMTSGVAYCAPALVRKTQTYTKCRFCTRGAGATVTGLRVAVFAADLTTFLTQTADQSGSFALNTRFDNVSLLSGLNLTAGQIVWLCVGSVAGTAVAVQGRNPGISAGMANTPSRMRNFTGLTGTADMSGSVIGGSGSQHPWVELLP